MCGIVGAVAERDVVPFLIDGLKRLEYRGYDSAGIAVLDGDNGAPRAPHRPRGRDGGRRAGGKPDRPCRHRPHALGHARRRHRSQRASARQFRRARAWCTTASSRTTRSSASACSALGYAFESQTDTEVIAPPDPPLLARRRRPAGRDRSARSRDLRRRLRHRASSHSSEPEPSDRRAHGLPAAGRPGRGRELHRLRRLGDPVGDARA